ncbi:hypothetical protein ABPG74_021835 [Tetrahymena malaccensis]
MRNSQISNFSFINHINNIQIGDDKQTNQFNNNNSNLVLNTNSSSSSPNADQAITPLNEKQNSFVNNLENVNVTNFLKDNKKIFCFNNSRSEFSSSNEMEYQYPGNSNQNKKIVNNILKINSQTDPNNSFNNKLQRDEAISNYNSDISTCKQVDIDQNKLCPRHPSKVVRYHLISNSLVQFCSKCALEYAVNGVKIEKNENLREKKLDYDKISIKISQNSKDSSLFTITKNTQPDTQQTLHTETANIEQCNESYKNEKLRVFMERVGYTNQFLKQTEESIIKKLDESQRYFQLEEKKIVDTFEEIMKSILNEKNEIMLLSKHSNQESNNLLLTQLESIRKQQNEINQFSEDISINIDNIIFSMEKQPFDDIINRYNQRISQINTFTIQLSSQQVSLLEINQNFENIKIVKAKILPNLLTIKQNSITFREFLNSCMVSPEKQILPIHNNFNNADINAQFPHKDLENQNSYDNSCALEIKPKISSTKNIKQKIMSPCQNTSKSNTKINYFKIPQNTLVNRSYDAGLRNDASQQLNTSLNLNSSFNKLNNNLLNNSFSHTSALPIRNNESNSRAKSMNCQKPNIQAFQESNLFSYTHKHGKKQQVYQAQPYFQKFHNESLECQREKNNLKLKQVQNESIAKHIQRQNKDKKQSNQSSLNPSRRASKHQYLVSQQESLHENYGKSTNEFLHEEDAYKSYINNNTSFDNSFSTNIGPEKISINNPSSGIIGQRSSQYNKSTSSHVNPVFNHSLNNISHQQNNNSIFNKSQNNITNTNKNTIYTQVLKTMKGRYNSNNNNNNSNHQTSKQNNNLLNSQNNSFNNSHFNSMNTDINDINPNNISISNKENLTLQINTMF